MVELNGHLDIVEQPSPSTPDVGRIRLYSKTDKKLYYKDDNGTERELGTTSSSNLRKTVYAELTSTDITNKYYDLPDIPIEPVEESVKVEIISGSPQIYGVDYAVVSSPAGKRRVTWDPSDPSVTTGLVSLLTLGDNLRITYTYT